MVAPDMDLHAKMALYAPSLGHSVVHFVARLKKPEVLIVSNTALMTACKKLCVYVSFNVKYITEVLYSMTSGVVALRVDAAATGSSCDVILTFTSSTVCRIPELIRILEVLYQTNAKEQTPNNWIKELPNGRYTDGTDFSPPLRIKRCCHPRQRPPVPRISTDNITRERKVAPMHKRKQYCRDVTTEEPPADSETAS